MAISLNFSYEIAPPSDGGKWGGISKDGKASGLVGDLKVLFLHTLISTIWYLIIEIMNWIIKIYFSERNFWYWICSFVYYKYKNRIHRLLSAIQIWLCMFYGEKTTFGPKMVEFIQTISSNGLVWNPHFFGSFIWLYFHLCQFLSWGWNQEQKWCCFAYLWNFLWSIHEFYSPNKERKMTFFSIIIIIWFRKIMI